MIPTSVLYKQIVSAEPHWFETKISITGNTLTEAQIMSVSSERIGMSESAPSIGGVFSATLRLTIENPAFTIPKRAEIVVYYRAKNAAQTSEWLQFGVYYVDTQERNTSYNSVDSIDITAFDVMLKTEKMYPNTNHAWPYLDINVVSEIAADIGCSVDSRTVALMTANYMVNLPVDYTEREVLSQIATAYCGNFVITPSNTLLLVPLYGNDDSNIVGNYLADDDGTTALLFGDEGWFILV